MNRYVERMYARTAVEATIHYRGQESEGFACSRLVNVSPGGACFEARKPVSADGSLWIRMPAFPAGTEGPGSGGLHAARVRWCRVLEGEAPALYGVGVEFFDREHAAVQGAVAGATYFCDFCSTAIRSEAVCWASGSICLCMPCYEHLDRLPEGAVKACVLRFLDGNVV